MAKAVIIELDYKASYSRFALTSDEFKAKYLAENPDMNPPTETGDSYTLKHLVHLWYKLVDIDGRDWNTFFTDMSWGLPETDIEANNLAYIDYNACRSLRDKLIIKLFNNTKHKE